MTQQQLHQTAHNRFEIRKRSDDTVIDTMPSRRRAEHRVNRSAHAADLYVFDTRAKLSYMDGK